MIWWQQQASITDGVLFYLHNISPLGRWCGLCKTTLDLWCHFHACYHRKYECLSACVRGGKSESLGYGQHWQLHTHSAHVVPLGTHTQIAVLCFFGDSEMWVCAKSQNLACKHTTAENVNGFVESVFVLVWTADWGPNTSEDGPCFLALFKMWGMHYVTECVWILWLTTH